MDALNTTFFCLCIFKLTRKPQTAALCVCVKTLTVLNGTDSVYSQTHLSRIEFPTLINWACPLRVARLIWVNISNFSVSVTKHSMMCIRCFPRFLTHLRLVLSNVLLLNTISCVKLSSLPQRNGFCISMLK